jgi:hypothetical protein
MIWGQVINSVRSLHLELLDHFAIPPAQFNTDVELSTEGFPFPIAGENFEEWETVVLPDKIQEALELHAVERALIEGPLLPIQEIIIKDEEWEPLILAILRLEKEWLGKIKLHQEDKYSFIEKNLRAKFLQLQKRAGRFSLKAV